MRTPYYVQGPVVLLIQRLLSGAIAVVFLLIVVGAAGYGLIVLVGAAKEILVVVIVVSASLLSAIFGYVFQRNKELEMAAVQRNKELELAQRKVMQDNYSRILERLAPYIRNPKQSSDDFSTAHLFTWVTGSAEVVRLSSTFMKAKDPESLDELLRAMRKDLMFYDSGSLQGVTTRELFPVPEPQGGFPA